MRWRLALGTDYSLQALCEACPCRRALPAGGLRPGRDQPSSLGVSFSPGRGPNEDPLGLGLLAGSWEDYFQPVGVGGRAGMGPREALACPQHPQVPSRTATFLPQLTGCSLPDFKHPTWPGCPCYTLGMEMPRSGPAFLQKLMAHCPQRQCGAGLLYISNFIKGVC